MCVCVCVYHIFFTHLSTDEQVGYFHVLSFVNNPAMNMGKHMEDQKTLEVKGH